VKERSISIPLQSTIQQERYPGIFLEDNTLLTITCDSSQVVEVDDIKIIEIDINKTKIDHGKEYKQEFKAVNQNGNVISCLGISKKTKKAMSGSVRLLTTLDSAYYDDTSKWGTCEDDSCYNRGRCYTDLNSGIVKFCVCPERFVGIGCQETAEGVSKLTFAIVILIIGGIALLFLGSAVRYYHKHKNEKKLRKNYVCHICNKQRCHQHIDDQTQTSGGNVKSSNTNQEYTKLTQDDGL